MAVSAKYQITKFFSPSYKAIELSHGLASSLITKTDCLGHSIAHLYLQFNNILYEP